MIITTFFLSSCDEEGGNFNERMGRIPRGIKKADSIADKISEGTTKFAKKVESYADTTKYRKDSTGMWVEK